LESKRTRLPGFHLWRLLRWYVITAPKKHVNPLISVQTRAVAQAVSEKDFEKAMSLRDPEFVESLDGFIATATLAKEKLLPKDQVNPIAYITGPLL
jgi:hypothetical protein